jgi:hypothetical protein
VDRRRQTGGFRIDYGVPVGQACQGDCEY